MLWFTTSSFFFLSHRISTRSLVLGIRYVSFNTYIQYDSLQTPSISQNGFKTRYHIRSDSGTETSVSTTLRIEGAIVLIYIYVNWCPWKMEVELNVRSLLEAWLLTSAIGMKMWMEKRRSTYVKMKLFRRWKLVYAFISPPAKLLHVSEFSSLGTSPHESNPYFRLLVHLYKHQFQQNNHKAKAKSQA